MLVDIEPFELAVLGDPQVPRALEGADDLHDDEAHSEDDDDTGEAADELRPQLRGPGTAQATDGLTLGIAQAAALLPGISRNGATLTAARARCFTREQANLLSRTIALPVIVGAAALKGARLRRRGVDPGLRRAIAVGIVASFASTLASQRLIELVERDRALWPYAAYRVVLAAVVAARLRGTRRMSM